MSRNSEQQIFHKIQKTVHHQPRLFVVKSNVRNAFFKFGGGLIIFVACFGIGADPK